LIRIKKVASQSPLPAALVDRGIGSVLCRNRLRRAKAAYVYFQNEPGRRSRGHEPLPKNSNNSPRHTITQNNTIKISVCNLACAARFRANAWYKSVGMTGRRHSQPLLRKNNAYRALAVPHRARQQSAAKLLTKDEARPTICQYREYRF
jgi:hypothetical protein